MRETFASTRPCLHCMVLKHWGNFIITSNYSLPERIVFSLAYVHNEEVKCLFCRCDGGRTNSTSTLFRMKAISFNVTN